MNQWNDSESTVTNIGTIVGAVVELWRQSESASLALQLLADPDGLNN
jgi:hypothetical protein